MRQNALKKKLALKKETISQLNRLEMDNSKGGIIHTTIDVSEISRYTDPDKTCDTVATCIICWYPKTFALEF